MALTRITKGVIKPNENYDTHNINSTGIVTAIGLDVNGNGDISGNLSVGGVLTYEDVTSIDSVGIITAQKDIHVGAGVSVVGIVTATTFKGDGDFVDLDVDGHTNLDNVSVAGVSTFNDHVNLPTGDKIVFGNTNQTQGYLYFDGSTTRLQTNHGLNIGSPVCVFKSANLAETMVEAVHNGAVKLWYDYSTYNTPKLQTTATGVTIDGTAVAGALDISGDIDVDGHTNLDNVNVAGVSTFTGNADFSAGIDVTGVVNSTVAGGDNNLQIETTSSGDPRLKLAAAGSGGHDIEYIRSSNTLNFKQAGGSVRLSINAAGHLLPGTDSQYNIGSNAVRFASIYADTLYGDGSNLTGIAADKIFEGNTKAEVVDTGSDGKFIVETEGTQRLEINSTGNFTLGTAASAGKKLYFQSTSGAAQYIASGGTNYQDLLIGSSAEVKLTIHEDSSIIIGNFTPVDTRNVGGLHIPANKGISFRAFSGSTASRNWRIRNDDLSNFGDLNISVGDNNTSDIPDTASDMVMTFTKERNVIIGDPTYGSSLGQLRIINNASSTPASLSLFGYGNTTDEDSFAEIQFAEQESGTGGQVKAKIEAQTLGTTERGADLVFKTAAATASSSATEKLRIDSVGNLGVNLNTPRITRGIHISKGAGDGGIGNSYSVANEYLHFGYSEHNSSGDKGLFTMGFGYVAGGTPATNSPAYLGYRETSVAGYTNGALVFATRGVTTDTAPTERVRIASDGTTTISGVPSYGAISKTASSSTYGDVFVYDTRKDSDGGAWRHRTNNTSWYNETLNTSIRGARREFPQVAIIAVGTSFLHIFDADDPDMPMWMEFPAPSGGARNVMYGTGNPRCVYMLNGILCTGSQAANYWPVLIDFIRDDILGLRSATGHNHYNGRQGNISLRNSATSDNTYWWPDTVANGASQNGRIAKRWWFDGTIVNKFVTSVVMSVRPEAPIDKTTGMQIPTIYLGTRGGVSIIHSNVGDTGTSYNSSVYNITSNNGLYSGVGDITITDDGYLWTLHDYYNYNSDGGYNFYRDSSAIDLKRLDNQMNNLTTSPSADTVSSLNNQGGGSANKGREYYWVSTGAEAGTHRIGYSNTWAANIVERDAWGSPSGLAFVKRGIYTYDHKESGSFLPRSHQNRGLVAMITNDYNTGWHMTGSVISSCYITQGLTSNISAGAAAMLDFGHHLRNLDVVGTLTRAACATGSDLSCVSGFSGSNYARIINASLNAGNPLDITLMGWIKLTDISGYSYLCSISTGSANMGIAVHASDSSNGGKPYFYDSTHGSLQGDKGINDGEWHHVCGVFSCSSNRKILYVDGVRSGGTTAPSNVDYSDLDTIAVGHWCSNNNTIQHSCTGSLALVKLGQTDLTDQQIKKIYEDEKKLFLPNAKAFLYGSSSGITAIGYDEKKEIYHVGTSSGRSDFSGLSRINNTTTAVTTAISAYDGLIAEQ